MTARFAEGAEVRVRSAWPESGPARVHIRTPHFLRGKRGTIDRVLGAFANPEDLAFGRPGLPKQPLYRVRFEHRHVWPAAEAGPRDTLTADIYEHWLEAERTHG